MAYCTQAQIEGVFGARNVALWSNLDKVSVNDGVPAVVAQRITDAIAWADEQIDNRFRNSRYLIPLTPAAVTVSDWAAKLAGVWLYRSRGFRKSAAGEDIDDRIASHEKEVHDDINLYLSGARSLACVKSEARYGTAPSVIVKTP